MFLGSEKYPISGTYFADTLFVYFDPQGLDPLDHRVIG
jgi:hypothetical protein